MRKWHFLVALFTTFLVGLSSTVSAQPWWNGRHTAPQFEFALTGDLPYDSEQEPKFNNVINDINRSRLAFVIHDGDFKSGSTLCSDETFYQRKELFETFEAPLIFVPGDNEWTDCHRANNGSYDPLERLAKLREIFFQGDQSLGKQRLRLTRQSEQEQYSKFRENVRWVYGDVMFLGLNIPGSNNNFGRTSEADAEYFERNAANLAWMRSAFDIAKSANSRGIMLIIQANPGFELLPTDSNRTGFNDFLAALEAETLAFGKPVVLVHGDSHSFQINKPLFGSKSKRRIENFTRVETFGSPDVHWLRASVNFKDPNVFNFQQEIVEENLVDHQL